MISNFAAFADQYGWGLALLVGFLAFAAKNYAKFLAFLAKLFPFWERRQMTKSQAQQFEQEQQAKVAALTFEEQERRDTILVLKDTLKLLVEDKKQEQRERKDLQDHLIEIVKEQARREAEFTGALQGLSRVVILQTDRLTDLTAVIEKIVGANNR